LFLNFLFLLTSSGRVRTIDEVTVDFETESLVRRGNTAVPQAVAAGLYYGKVDREGNPQAPYGAGQALLLAPWYVLGRAVRAVTPGIPAEAGDVVSDAIVTASSATFAAAAAGLAFLILVRVGVEDGAAAAAALVLALATPLFAYSSWLFSEPVAAALLLGAALALFGGGTTVGISWQRALVAGILLGSAMWVRPTHAIAAPVYLLAVVVREREKALRPALALAAVVAVFGAAQAVRNEFLFGSPLDFGYPGVVEGGKIPNSFQTPLLTGLFGFLLSPGKSVFLFAPPVLLGIAGLRGLVRRDRGVGLVAGVTPLVYLLFFARYTQWEGGYCFGPRYLLPAIILLCLGIGPALAGGGSRMRSCAVILFLAGFCAQLVGMSTSFLEDQANGSYYDQHWNYRMNYSPLQSQTRLLWHYISSTAPAPIGRGFDRWFVFLAKAGVSRTAIALGLGIQIGAAVFLGLQLLSELRRPLPLGAGSPSAP
jgi:hypothetical protein